MPEPATERSLFHSPADEPLASRMRPRTLEEYIGQDHILGPGRLLRRAIRADQISSLIFYGPPGTGKTTLARVIANSTRAHFTALNAVLSGVKDIREAVAAARERLRAGHRTILFVDEVHRFNKAQQDALLPWVENGTVILVGATTENPYFEVNKALVSRSRIFQLTPLGEDDLRAVARAALADPERGYGRRRVLLDDDALEHLVNVANGDARALLNALELAVTTTPEDDEGRVRIDRSVAEESIQRRAVLYDKEGDAHFDTISAFIKSVRGSDPDAALYWLAKMVYAGEDPRFIFRRLVILASEDVGLATPEALPQVMAAAQAFDYVGMPEGRYHLAQATLFLATAPKSNSTMAFFDALAAVGREREAEVPNHLKDGSRDAEGFGHGEGYLYPHAYRDHWVAQQYLPGALQGKVFYQPSEQGYEARVREAVARQREAQLAAMLEASFASPVETFTSAPDDPQRERWLQRTVSSAGARLGALRDELMERAAIARHEVVLDLDAASGLLAWEALRRAPEGQVWALAADARAAEALEQQAANLPELQRPVVVRASAREAAAAVAARFAELEPAAGRSGERGEARDPLRFDAVVGRNVLSGLAGGEGEAAVGEAVGEAAWLAEVAGLLRAGGRLALAEGVPLRSQRLTELVKLDDLGAAVADAAHEAEAASYAASDDPRFRWTPDGLGERLREAGFQGVAVEPRDHTVERRVSRALLDAWFPEGGGGGFARVLAARLDLDEVKAVEEAFRLQLTNRVVGWRTRVVLIRGVKG